MILSPTTTKISPWTYNDEPVTSNEQMPLGTIAFVYLITRKSDGKFYYGKKMSVSTKTSVKTITRKNGTKAKKKTRTLVPSDWPNYWSSSAELLKDVQELGHDAFTRKILCYCGNKGSASYYELRYQMDARVLEIGDKSYNGIVNARIHHSHVRPILF